MSKVIHIVPANANPAVVPSAGTVATELRALADRAEKGELGEISRVLYVIVDTQGRQIVGHTGGSPGAATLIGELIIAQQVILGTH
jgi:hypothetical protein